MHPPLHGADADPNINSTQSADANVNAEVLSAASSDAVCWQTKMMNEGFIIKDDEWRVHHQRWWTSSKMMNIIKDDEHHQRWWTSSKMMNSSQQCEYKISADYSRMRIRMRILVSSLLCMNWSRLKTQELNNHKDS